MTFRKEENQYRPQCLSQILHNQNYPPISEICRLCLGPITKLDKASSCKSCMMSWHSVCLFTVYAKDEVMKKAVDSIQFICMSCVESCKLQQSKGYLEINDLSIYLCSICLRNIHKNCLNIPNKLLFSNHPFLKEKFFRINRIVCNCCVSFYGVETVYLQEQHENQTYLLVKIDHPSPIHYTWLSRQQMEQLRPKIQLASKQNEEFQIQLVLSMHIPLSLALHTIDEIEDMLLNIKHDAQTINKIRFLVKWRHNFNCFIWQEMQVVNMNKTLIPKFLHLLKLNSIKSELVLNKRIFISNLANQNLYKNCINDYSSKYQINEQVSFINISPMRIAYKCKKNVEEQHLQNIYSIWAKSAKQLVNIQDQLFKGTAMSSLINTIYFKDKNSSPIAIFTELHKVNWWQSVLKKNTPFLNCLALQGPQNYLESLIQKFFMTRLKVHNFLFKFNVVILPYQNLKLVSDLTYFGNIISSFSLLIMDQKMSAFAKYFYINTKVARIKFSKDDVDVLDNFTALNHKKQQKLEAESDVKYDKQENSWMKKLSETKLSSPIDNQGYKQDTDIKYKSNKHTNQNSRKIDQRWSSLRRCYLSNPFNYYNQILSQTDCLAFLKFVLAFGIRNIDQSQFYRNLLSFGLEHKINKEALLVNLEIHTGYFLAILSSFAKQIPTIEEERLTSIFTFCFKPKFIFKRITDIIRINTFCQNYHNRSQIFYDFGFPKIFINENIMVLEQWTIQLDYIYCKILLGNGMGQWDAISEAEDEWEPNSEKTKFRYYICDKIRIGRISSGYFGLFLKIRIEEILCILEKDYSFD